MTAPADLGFSKVDLPAGGHGTPRVEPSADQTDRPAASDARAAQAGPAVGAPGKAPAERLAALVASLNAAPWTFDFSMAVRRLENAMPHLPRVGHSGRLSEDVVRFGQEPTLTFAPATLSDFTPAASDGSAPHRLFVRFLGLCGPNGAMPLHITEFLRERSLHHNDHSPARFFDVFNHRMIALFYRAWATNQQPVSFERGADQRARAATQAMSRRAEPDRFAVMIASFFGQGMPSFRERDAAPDLAKLHYAGWLSNHVKNADGLEAMVGDLMGVPCHVETFVGQWVKLPPESFCRLGGLPSATELGTSTIVGSQVWSVQQAFRIRLGPMSFSQYQRFLPGKWSLKKLAAIVRNYIGDELDWTVKLVLKADEVPRVQLGALGQVGWSTWLGSQPFTNDVEDLELRPTAAA
jgi:type VI secretion system protein ImpH